jgi:hypothetical protein
VQEVILWACGLGVVEIGDAVVVVVVKLLGEAVTLSVCLLLAAQCPPPVDVLVDERVPHGGVAAGACIDHLAHQLLHRGDDSIHHSADHQMRQP